MEKPYFLGFIFGYFAMITLLNLIRNYGIIEALIYSIIGVVCAILILGVEE